MDEAGILVSGFRPALGKHEVKVSSQKVSTGPAASTLRCPGAVAVLLLGRFGSDSSAFGRTEAWRRS